MYKIKLICNDNTPNNERYYGPKTEYEPIYEEVNEKLFKTKKEAELFTLELAKGELAGLTESSDSDRLNYSVSTESGCPAAVLWHSSSDGTGVLTTYEVFHIADYKSIFKEE